jgi:hypothetical protein
MIVAPAKGNLVTAERYPASAKRNIATTKGDIPTSKKQPRDCKEKEQRH